MSELNQLVSAIQDELPSATVRATSVGASNWLDIEFEDRFVTVEWRTNSEIGISELLDNSNPAAGLFEGPDRICTSWYSAKDHILDLLGCRKEEPFARVAAAYA